MELLYKLFDREKGEKGEKKNQKRKDARWRRREEMDMPDLSGRENGDGGDGFAQMADKAVQRSLALLEMLKGRSKLYLYILLKLNHRIYKKKKNWMLQSNRLLTFLLLVSLQYMTIYFSLSKLN